VDSLCFVPADTRLRDPHPGGSCEPSLRTERGSAPGVQQAIAEDDVGGGLDALAAPGDRGPHRPRRHAPLLLAALDGALQVEWLMLGMHVFQNNFSLSTRGSPCHTGSKTD